MPTLILSVIEAERLALMLEAVQVLYLDHDTDIRQRTTRADTTAGQLCRQWASWAADFRERLQYGE